MATPNPAAPQASVAPPPPDHKPAPPPESAEQQQQQQINDINGLVQPADAQAFVEKLKELSPDALTAYHDALEHRANDLKNPDTKQQALTDAREYATNIAPQIQHGVFSDTNKTAATLYDAEHAVTTAATNPATVAVVSDPAVSPERQAQIDNISTWMGAKRDTPAWDNVQKALKDSTDKALGAVNQYVDNYKQSHDANHQVLPASGSERQTAINEAGGVAIHADNPDAHANASVPEEARKKSTAPIEAADKATDDPPAMPGTAPPVPGHKPSPGKLGHGSGHGHSPGRHHGKARHAHHAKLKDGSVADHLNGDERTRELNVEELDRIRAQNPNVSARPDGGRHVVNANGSTVDTLPDKMPPDGTLPQHRETLPGQTQDIRYVAGVGTRDTLHTPGGPDHTVIIPNGNETTVGSALASVTNGAAKKPAAANSKPAQGVAQPRPSSYSMPGFGPPAN